MTGLTTHGTEELFSSFRFRTQLNDLHRITKNLVSKTREGEYALLVVPGDSRVDLKAAAKVLKTKNVRLMPFSESMRPAVEFSSRSKPSRRCSAPM